MPDPICPVDGCNCGGNFHSLDLYDMPYSDDLPGRWRARSGAFYLVVEGPGDRPGSVAVHAEHKPTTRQDDMPIATLRINYEELR